MRTLREKSDLKRCHIVIAEDFEYLLEESLACIGHGAWAKSRDLLEPCENRSQSSDALPWPSEGEAIDQFKVFDEIGTLSVTRTFLHYVPPQRQRDDEIKSETNSRIFVNPRTFFDPSD